MNFSKFFLLSLIALSTSHILSTEETGINENTDPLSVLSTYKTRSGVTFDKAYTAATGPNRKWKLIWATTMDIYNGLAAREKTRNPSLLPTKKELLAHKSILLALKKLLSELKKQYSILSQPLGKGSDDNYITNADTLISSVLREIDTNHFQVRRE